MQDILGCATIRPASNVSVRNYCFKFSYARNISTQVTHSGCLPGRPAVLPDLTPMHVDLTDFDICTVWVLYGYCVGTALAAPIICQICDSLSLFTVLFRAIIPASFYSHLCHEFLQWNMFAVACRRTGFIFTSATVPGPIKGIHLREVYK